MSNEDWFFFSIFRATEYKVGLNTLYYEMDFVDVMKLDEYLEIESARQEATYLDDKLNNEV